MKKIMTFVLAATVMLLGGSASLFADGSTCKTTFCNSTKNKNHLIKTKQVKNAVQFETDPFTILIPGNHF